MTDPALTRALAALPPDRPVLIAGPTASGKSALALRIAEEAGGVIVNADALQVYAHWSVLTARPGPRDLARVPHALYGHVAREAPYSAGHWLREAEELLRGGMRPIFTGGTGLYFMALTEGLAPVPEVPAEVRAEADGLSLAELSEGLDAQTRSRTDMANRARVQRAWEVLRATGRGLAAWQAEQPAPPLPSGEALRIVVDAPTDWLNPRLARRFDAMLDGGALEEARANLGGYDPARPGDRAIGAPELVSHLRGEITLEAARDRAVIATRQYAKRQRTWFRRRMGDWLAVRGADLP
ncbi:tRNA (adenosine(37)-N6)-dimethylallyltransferase MiaA [Roseicyclus sp. F158]|uniref:tRNA dimethylallyltransferase n=1 Tax=Tropicimonas omnivorans TaxID=3075590 RepID=A0ABU3DJ10_9RHOB|nr:tRNA (adenosine(37)-N6)-dimethylallyltransferase MiaA [Roseicyclus sp. F158]MDT0683711.1 tRNA (adenosine(37)-N6)-dimethylallyltransferase MiaA [Roseicyclus sp. F158]